MKTFILRYALFLLLLFTLFYAQTSSVSLFLNELQTGLTLYGLEYFLKPHQLIGIDIIINPHYKIIINKACNGMIPILILSASILAYPSSVVRKIGYILSGYVLFSVVNLLRILIVVHFVSGSGGSSNFYWSHDLLGNALMMIFGLSFFVLFIKSK